MAADPMLTAVTDLSQQLSELAARVKALESGSNNGAGESGRYQPIPAPQLWRRLHGQNDSQRKELTQRLRSWVATVFRPGYGHLAVLLPSCWEQHELCLYVLDVLSELHSVLYLNKGRTISDLGGQAELYARLMPALADLLSREGKSCGHRMNGGLR